MTDRPFRIRLATPEDARDCALVHHTSWVETYSDLLPASHWESDTLSLRTQSWTRSLDRGRPVTVAESDGQIIGIALTNPSRTIGDHAPVRELELSVLYVLAAHHGTGVGQALLEAALAPGAPAQLWVLKRNPRARRFYERHGFALDGARYIDPHLNLAEVRYVR